MRKLYPMGLLAAAALLLWQCVPDRFEIAETDNWQPAFGIPIVNTTVSVKDILEDFDTEDILETGVDGRLTIVYEDQLSVDVTYDPPIPSSIPLPIAEKEQNAVFDPPGNLRFDLIRLESGQLRYNVPNDQPEQVDFSLTLENLTLDGEPFTLSLSLPAASGGQPGRAQGSLPIEGYELRLGDEIRTVYSAFLSSDGSPVELPLILLELQNLDFSYVEGYFGSFPISIATDSISYDFLEEWEAGDVEFLEPLFRFTFDNTFGLPVSMRADTLDMLTYRSGLVEVANETLDNGLFLAFPGLDEVGEVQSTVLTLNSGNSNVVEAISGLPFQLRYGFEGTANPGNNPLVDNHLTDSARLGVNLEVEIPLYARARAFQFSEQFELDLSDIPEEAERLEMKTVTDNGFPIELQLQAYFLNAEQNVFDSLFVDGPQRIASAELGFDATVTESVETALTAPLSGDRLQFIRREAEEIRLTVGLSSPMEGQTPARLRDTYQVGLRMGVLAGF